MEVQGYKVKDNVFHQDNQSAIISETNGKGSSVRRTMHINTRYFFICDRVAAGEVSVRYCPTGEKKDHFFTKPLQGTNFRRFRCNMLKLDASTEKNRAK